MGGIPVRAALAHGTRRVALREGVRAVVSKDVVVDEHGELVEGFREFAALLAGLVEFSQPSVQFQVVTAELGLVVVLWGNEWRR